MLCFPYTDLLLTQEQKCNIPVPLLPSLHVSLFKSRGILKEVFYYCSLGVNHGTLTAPKHCSLHGCSDSASELVHCYRVFVQVCSSKFYPFQLNCFPSTKKVTLELLPMSNGYSNLVYRGSLYKLLQMHGAGVILDDRQRLNMAYDVVGLKQTTYLNENLSLVRVVYANFEEVDPSTIPM